MDVTQRDGISQLQLLNDEYSLNSSAHTNEASEHARYKSTALVGDESRQAMSVR